ncbi:MAG: DUF4148 domain-containing protein [Rubrivivax sp.]|nr:MAG: DUF4148 domain-containing protein [Rubrivivax sp.]
MKNARTAFLAILTAALAVPALADTGSAVITRDQVKAEYLRALKAGELDYGREFVSAPVVAARQAPNTTAATKIEDLSPTGAGSRDGAKSAAAPAVHNAN